MNVYYVVFKYFKAEESKYSFAFRSTVVNDHFRGFAAS